MSYKAISEAFTRSGYKFPEGASPTFGHHKKDLSIVTGIVKYVDYERQTMSCELFNQKYSVQEIALTHPYAGNSSFIAGMPEKGSVVVLAMIGEMIFPIAYIPTYLYALDQKTIQKWPDNVATKKEDNYFHYRFRKLRYGEIDISSSEGAELFLSNNILLENSFGDSFQIRESDHALITSSLNTYNFNSGVWMSSGLVQRNMLSPESNGTDFIYQRILRDGKVVCELKPDNVDYLSKHYTEFLIEAQEHGLPEIPVNSINHEMDEDHRNPVGILALGNFVGNNYMKTGTYGKLLGVSLFNDFAAQDGIFEFKALTGEDPERYGIAAMLYKPDRDNYEHGALLAIDKEGHFYQYIPSATAGGLGMNRSMSILARGSKKEVWGADGTTGNSWDMTLKGGLKWVIGAHEESDLSGDLKGRSIHVVTKGPAYYQYGEEQENIIRDFRDPKKLTTNPNRYKKVEKIGGAERVEISGTREVSVGGNDECKIVGMKREKVSGSMVTYVGGNYHVSIGDQHTLKVTGESQESLGSKKVECVKGSHELKITTVGDIKETIIGRGNRSVKITTGNIQEQIVTRGNKIFKALSGNYQVTTGQGNVTHKTTVGNVISETKAGKSTMKSTLGMTLQTSGALKTQGTKVSIKTPTPMSGGITKLSHQDYVTGAPLRSSKTVKIST